MRIFGERLPSTGHALETFIQSFTKHFLRYKHHPYQYYNSFHYNQQHSYKYNHLHCHYNFLHFGTAVQHTHQCLKKKNIFFYLITHMWNQLHVITKSSPILVKFRSQLNDINFIGTKVTLRNAFNLCVCTLINFHFLEYSSHIQFL